jgi:hypothetical protein
LPVRPEGDQVQHTLSLTFAHPSIAARQPLYQIKWRRVLPDVALVPHAKIEYSFDKARAELFRTYGRPTEAREEKTTSAAAKKVQREDKGRLPEDMQSTVCDCGSRYVIATLAISSSPATIPKNQYLFYRSVSLSETMTSERAKPNGMPSGRKSNERAARPVGFHGLAAVRWAAAVVVAIGAPPGCSH